MFDLSRFRLQDMTACGAALRQLGAGAPSIEVAADRITRYLYTTLTTGPDEDPACLLVRAFKTHPYQRLSQELQALVDAQLGGKPDNHEMKCLTLLGSAGAVPGWNNPALSSRFRVIPLDGPGALAKLPMFSQLFAQFHIDLPFLENPSASLLLDQYSSTFNAFHVPQALNSPYVPNQQEFIVPFGVQSVLGFGGLLQTAEMFAVVLFATVPIPKETADLVRTFALSAKLALAPFEHEHLIIPTPASSIPTKESDSLSALRHRVDTLEAVLSVQEQTVQVQSSRLDAALAAAQEQTKQIQAQRLQFESLAATSPIGIFQTDAAGQCIYTNAAWQSITGLSLADSLGDRWSGVIHQEDRSRVFAVWEQSAQQGQDFSLEFRMQRPDGTIRWVHSRARPMRNETGTVIGHVGTTEDITERKQAEAMLHEQREQLQAIVDGTSDAVFIKDLQGRYLLFNAAGGRFVGKHPTDVIGQDDTFLFPPDDARAVIEGDRRVMAGGKLLTYDDYVTTPDGVRRTFSATKGPLFDQQGTVSGMFGISRDITEQKHFEEILRQSEERYRRYFELGLIGMAVTSLEKGWVQVNDRLCEIFGYSHDELLTKTWTELTHPDDVAADLAQFNRVLAGEIDGYAMDKRFLHKNGRVIQASISTSAVRRSDGSIDHFVALVQDFSARHEAEERLKKSELQLQQQIKDMPVGHIMWDREFRVVSWNPAAERIFGYTAGEAIGRHASFIITEESRSHVDEVWQRLIAGDKTAHSTNDNLTKDGRRIACQWANTPLRDAEGQVTGAFSMVQDVTEQQRYQTQLRQTEERWTYAFEGNGDGVWDWDALTNHVFFSKRWKEMLGYAEDEVGHTLDEWSSRVHPDDFPKVMADVQRHLQGATPVYANEHRVRCKDGSYKWILDRGKVISRAPDGSPLRVVGTHSDITVQKAFENAIAERYCLQDSILANAVHAIIATDPSGIITIFNPAAERMLGYTADEMIGILTPAVFHDSDEVVARARQFGSELGITLAAGFDVFVEKSRRGLPNQHEWTYVRKDGVRLPVLLGISELRDSSGALIGYLGIAIDLSERQQAETSLQEQAHQLRAILNHAVDGIITIDEQGLIESFNPAAERLFGYAAADAIGRNVKMLMPEPYHSEHDGYLTHYRQTGQAKIIGIGREVVGRRKDGSVFPLELGVSQIQLGSKRLFTGIVRDLTSERLHHAELQGILSAINRIQASVEFALDGTILTANENFLALMGYSLPELQGQHHRIFCDQAYVSSPAYQEFWTKLQRGEFDTSIYPRINKSGNRVWLQSSYNPIFDASGVPYKIVKFATDITLRKQTEAMRFRLQQAINHAQDGMALLDEAGEFTYMNPAYASIYGYAVDDLLGTSWTRLYPGEWAAMIEQMYLPTLRSEGQWQGEVVGKKRSGEAFHVDLSLSLLEEPDTGRQTILCTCRDISHRKQMELDLIAAKNAAEAGIRAKSEFLATMSHEIRTPMNGVLGMTDLLIDTALTAEQREFVHTLKHSGESLMRIINDILDFSKIEAGKLTIETLPFDLRMTIEDTLDLLAPTAQAKGLELIGLIDAQAPNAMIGDPGRIRQILTNLIGNAIKFTERGEVLVQVLKAEESASSVLLRFEIVDTGVGLTEEAKAKLFQSFTQADSSTARKYGGTGLGLAICKRLTELMGGQIGIQSFPGSGTCVWFTIRLLTQTDTTALPPPALIDNLGGLRICLVDDNATNRSLLQYHACDWKMHYESAEDGPSALALIRRAALEGKPFDLAILDMHMPGMDGLALGRAIRDDANLDHTRLVLLTSLGRRGDAKVAHTAGFSAYLTKPVRKKHLYDCLRLVMGQAPASHAERSTAPTAPPLITRHQVAEMHANLRLLVMDDNPVNQKVAVKILEKLGYRVDVAGNGKEALLALTQHPYSLVFMDCQMPELDGFETTRMIRSHEQPGSRLPIIAMTANAMEGDREHCLSSGMDDFVSKPVKSQDLSTLLTRWLNRSDDRAAA